MTGVATVEEPKKRTSTGGTSGATSSVVTVVEEEPHHREQWSATLDFILSCVGYAVGFGNLTRFPYICGRNGGATFLIPYFIMMVFTGFPVFFLELGIGQYSQVSPLKLYRRMSPIFRGLGPTMVLITVFTCVYYNVQMAWGLIYLFDSFYYPISGSPLPFSDCTHDWNTDYCYNIDVINATDCHWNKTIMFQNEEIYESVYKRYDMYYGEAWWMFFCINKGGACFNVTYNATDLKLPLSEIDELHERVVTMMKNSTYGASPAQEYNDHMLGYNRTYSNQAMTQWGPPQYPIVIALFIAWLIMFLMLFRGLKMSGKIVYFTALFPYVCLAALLVVGMTLPGKDDGLDFYLNPNMTRLQELSPWKDAASQIFFSLSVGGGGLSTLASYNKFQNNIFRDTIIVVLGNCATSIFCGFVIFPILGYEANRLYANSEITMREAVSRMAESGPSLAFIAYPGALASLPIPWLWSIIFFFMLLLLGIDSENVMIEVVVTAVLDQWPSLRQGNKKPLTIAGVCFCGFLAGLVFTTPCGIELYTLMDTFAGGFTLTLACMIEVAIVAWIYDIRRFICDLNLMLGYPPNMCFRICGYPVGPYYILCWVVITPLLLITINVFQFLDFGITYGDKTYPDWAEIVGYSITGIIMIWTPLMAFWQMYLACRKSRSVGWLFKPQEDWGPQHPEDKALQDARHPYYGMFPSRSRKVKPIEFFGQNMKMTENEFDSTKF